MAQNKAAKIDRTTSGDKANATEHDVLVKKMRRFSPSLNGINKNLP